MSLPSETERNRERRAKRCFHRVMSGLEKGGSLRLITLTSSDTAPADIQTSFRKLAMRLRRRGLLTAYLKVIETKDDWRQHIHLIFRGPYLAKAMLSFLWTELHNSPIVDIRKVDLRYKSKRRVASYLAKYMAKELFRRYSWSWEWVYKGFVATWTAAKRLLFSLSPPEMFTQLWPHFLHLWANHCKNHDPPGPYLEFLYHELCYLRASGHSLPSAPPTQRRTNHPAP